VRHNAPVSFKALRWVLLGVAALAACGGVAVIDPPGDGAQGGDGDGGDGSIRCDDHADCRDGAVCVFATGRCAQACNVEAECDDGLDCDICGTSSCPACRDCRGACL
jgi:hypothetical protein